MTDATAKNLITVIIRLTDAVEKLTRQMEHSNECAECDGTGRVHNDGYRDARCPACGGTG